MNRKTELFMASRRILTLLCIGAGIIYLGSCQDGSPMSETLPGSVSFSLSMSPAAAAAGPEEEALIRSFDHINGLRLLVERVPSGEVAIDTTFQVAGGAAGYTLAVVVELLSDPEEFRMSMIGLQGETELFRAEQLVTLSSQDRQGGRSLLLPVSYSGPGIRARLEDATGNPLEGVTVGLEGENGFLETSETDAKGVALFIDVPPGTYRVRPIPLSGEGYCPTEHQVVLRDQDGLAAASFEAGKPCDARYLVLSGGDFNHNSVLEAELQSFLPESRFESYYFLNDPPALTMLVRYNAVLLYEDGVFGGSQILGNRVAEYLAQGGNLVVGTFYWQNRSDGPFETRGWGALEDSDIFSAAGGAKYTSGSMDPDSKVEHTVMSGVDSIESTGFWGGVAGGGSGVLARWKDGTPLIGVSGSSAGTRIVAISFFPVGGTSGDGTLLYANALHWAGTGNASSGATGSSGQAFSLAIPNPDSADPTNAKAAVNPSKSMGGTHHRR